MAVMLSTLEEESDMYEVFPPHVDTSSIPIVPDSPAKKNAKPLKTWSEISSLIQAGRKREVKLILREQGWPTNHTIRAQLWPALCKQHSSSRPMQDGFYWELVNQLFGTTDVSDKPMLLPAFVENTHCLPYHLTRRGRSLADRVVCVLGFSCPDITFSPALYPIASLLLHFMSEEECYNSLASLISSKDKTFITQTKLLYEATWRTVMLITKKHMKSAAAHLARHCSDARSERIYADWLWWILQGLPFTHLVRVMDCFFHEGIKVLYRVAMAILFLFYKYSTSQSSEWSAELAAQGVDNALTKFCRQMPVSPTKVLRTAFNVRGLSSSYIHRVFVKTEMLLKSKPVLSNSQQISRSRSSENLPTSQSQNNIQLVSHTLTIREGSRSPEPRTHAMGVYPIYKIRSAIVSQEEAEHPVHKVFGPWWNCTKLLLFTLWSWLPVRITMYQPILLYTTEEHGCSLTTFYVRVEQHEPTLLMIKTSNNEVFGAYCSTRWYERNVKDDRGNRQAYFGTGETFLFSLYPERAKYPWVGMEQSPGEKQLDHSAELFLAADHKMITIGGGEGQAIWMDENIRYGKTDRCLTFNNPPLCASGDFEIRVLEVYGFAGA